MKIRLLVLLILVTALTAWAQTDPDPNRFIDTIKSFRQWDAKNALPADPVLFVGSSSIRMWHTAEFFPDLPVVNRGFGGAHISDMLHFKSDILLNYPPPAAIVMYCGGNDVAGGKSAERVVDDFKTWWALVREAFPQTPLVYIAIKPCPARWEIWPTEKAANKDIEALCETDPLLYYADIATAMLNTGAPPADDLFLEDLLHMSDKGYRLWKTVVAPVLENALGQN